MFLLVSALEVSTGLTLSSMGLLEASSTIFSQVKRAAEVVWHEGNGVVAFCLVRIDRCCSTNGGQARHACLGDCARA